MAADTHQELLVEARQLVIGLINARLRGDVTDSRFLLVDWANQCASHGVPEARAYATLATAALIWAAQLVNVHARALDVDVDEVVQDLARATAEWAVSGGG